MKNIKDLLLEKKNPTLIHICQMFGLRGYSSLRKDGIINLISENLKKPQFQESIRFIIPDNGTVALIFKSLIDNNSEVGYKQLRKDVTQKRSGTTFRDNYRSLIAKCILFEDEKSEDDKIYLPKEFTNLAKSIIDKRLKEEPEPEPEIEEEEVKEVKTITNLDQLLYSKKYTSVSGLQNELMVWDQKISGTKQELIERILYESGEDLKNILGYVFGKVELKDICREFELKLSGTKDELIERILEKIPPKYPEKIVVKKEKIEIEREPDEHVLASGEVELVLPKVVVEESKLVKKVNLMEEIFNLLDNYRLDYRTITHKENFEGQVLSLLQNLKTINPLKFKNTTIKRSSKEPIILIIGKEQTIAVYVFFFEKKKTISVPTLKGRFLQNATDYKYKYSKDLIAYIYDPIGKLDTQTKEIYGKEYKLIYKKEFDFKD